MYHAKKIALAAVVAGALIAPAGASASYNMSQGQAEADVADAAEFRYEPWGVSVDDTFCAPQGTQPESRRVYGRYHRWTCTWTGYDGDGAEVYGQFRITGHTGDNYGYMPVRGGLRWS